MRLTKTIESLGAHVRSLSLDRVAAASSFSRSSGCVYMFSEPSGVRGHVSARPIAVQFESIAIRVTQIKCFANPVVTGAIQGNAGRYQAASASASAREWDRE